MEYCLHGYLQIINFFFLINICASQPCVSHTFIFRKNELQQLDRTPDGRFAALRPQKSFTQGMMKIQSLDFGLKKGNQLQRENEAKLYRQKLLHEKNKIKKIQPKPSSKIAEDLKRKKMEQDSSTTDGHGFDSGDAKASFEQCAFNMANILMVSFLCTGTWALRRINIISNFVDGGIHSSLTIT